MYKLALFLVNIIQVSGLRQLFFATNVTERGIVISLFAWLPVVAQKKNKMVLLRCRRRLCSVDE